MSGLTFKGWARPATCLFCLLVLGLVGSGGFSVDVICQAPGCPGRYFLPNGTPLKGWNKSTVVY